MSSIFRQIRNQCGWHVKRKVIWYVTKLRISEILCNIYFFQAAVSALFGSLSFVLQKKFRNRLREYSKIHNFVTYQITFLLTCQPHWTTINSYFWWWLVFFSVHNCQSPFLDTAFGDMIDHFVNHIKFFRGKRFFRIFGRFLAKMAFIA